MVSTDDPTTIQNSGVLWLALFLPAARYGSPRLFSLIRSTSFLPIVNGWTVGASKGFVKGEPLETDALTVQSSITGGSVVVTNPVIIDQFKLVTEEKKQPPQHPNAPPPPIVDWQIEVATVSRGALSKPVLYLFTLGLYAFPWLSMQTVEDASGMGSLVYITCGLLKHFVENIIFTVNPPRPVQPTEPMGLLKHSSAGIVIVRSDDQNPVNIDDVARPNVSLRFPRLATACRVVYRVIMALLLIGWIVFIVVCSLSTTVYTNGYIEIGTIVVAALGEVVVQNLVARSITVERVKKKNVITGLAWLAHRKLLDAPGVPSQLVSLKDKESKLIHALFQNQATDKLFTAVPQVDQDEVRFDGDGAGHEKEE